MRVLLSLILVLIAGIGVRAEHIPLKLYTTVEGLVRDQISRIVADSHGTVEPATSARFDRLR